MSDPIDPPAPTPARESFLDEYLESPTRIDKPRQGLPSTYRMRHDAHYVDELASRQHPSEATAPPLPSRATEPALVFSTSVPVTFALRDMSQELEGIASCFNLFADTPRPLRERLGLTLARVSVQRSMRGFQALRALLEDPSPDAGAVALNRVIERTLEGFDEEMGLTQATLQLQLQDVPIGLKADSRLLSLALQACVGSLIALIEASGHGGILQVSSGVTAGSGHCELRQDAYRMTSDQFARLTDLEWSDRPGGLSAGIALAAAARIAHAHGGQLDARRTEAGGCVLSLALPLAARAD